MGKWLLCIAALVFANGADAAAPRLELAWRLGGLANPESVALSADGRFLYVTNVDGEGEAKDGNGFIALVSTDGRLLNREFARGLDGPKGIALFRDVLYVADIDQLVIVDAASGAIRGRLPAPGAKFLNDLAIAPGGGVLIADSATQRIYVSRDDRIEVWLDHDLLRSVNGLLPEPERLIVTTMEGRLLAVDYLTRIVTVLAEGLGDADGVAALDGGRYFVSEWPGLMHVVSPDGTHKTILDSRKEKRFLNDFLLVGDTLYQPHWEPGDISAYRVLR